MTLTQLFTNIANAIRSKKGTSGTIIAENFSSEIDSIVTPNLQSKSVNITQNGTQTITPDSGYNGLDKIEIITDVQGGTSEYNAKINTVFTSTNKTILNNIIELPAINVGNLTNISSLFQNCMNLKSIELIGTDNITNVGNMCNGCISLENISQFNTSKITNFTNTFNNCSKFTDESLFNILAMCIGATAYKGTKTLYAIGFREVYYPTERIQALSNYQLFLDAGWTIGY